MVHPALSSCWDSGRPAFASWVTIKSDAIVQAVWSAGYDAVGLDCQHGAMAEEDAAALIRRSSSTACAILVRVSENSLGPIGRVLDAGADGVIVPMVSNADEARRAVAACRYPPEGQRSFGPSRPDLAMSVRELQDRAACFVMIETGEGISNAESIASVPGVAGIMIGPADLSIALGLDPFKAVSTDQLAEPVGVIRSACQRNGRVLGSFAAGGANAAAWADKGCRLVVVGGVIPALTRMLANELMAARKDGDMPMV